MFIDPLDSILMDFYLACWAANQEGKTEIINYSEWAAKIRKLFPYREDIEQRIEDIIDRAEMKSRVLEPDNSAPLMTHDITDEDGCDGLATCWVHKEKNKDAIDTTKLDEAYALERLGISPKKDNDELKDLGHVKEDFLK